MTDFEKKIYFGILLEIYGTLLTAKQYRIASSYYLLDMSLSEIAEEFGISRSAVLDTIQISSSKLDSYEQNINQLKLREKLHSLVECNDINEIKKNIKELL